jgi:hypothetical protein
MGSRRVQHGEFSRCAAGRAAPDWPLCRINASIGGCRIPPAGTYFLPLRWHLPNRHPLEEAVMTTPSQPGDDLNVEDLDVAGDDADRVTGGDGKVEYLKVTMTNTMISGHGQSSPPSGP